MGGPYGFLSRTGAAHADLYPEMINTLARLKGYCPVTRLYAASSAKFYPPERPVPVNRINYDGAVNSFCTARPLAASLSPQQSWDIPQFDPEYAILPNDDERKLLNDSTLCTNAKAGAIQSHRRRVSR